MAGKRGGTWLGRWLRRAVLALVAFTMLPVLCLRWVSPPTTSVMVQYRVSRMANGHLWPRVRYRWTDWEQIAPAMRLAAVAAEDQKFPRHWGFDMEAIADAVDEASARGRLRGASTITQQVARNLFLWQERSWVRKGLEAYFTALLELCWPKRRILEVYLNVAELGEGVYGVPAASQAYFGKPPSRLTTSEAALLAATFPNPRRLHVKPPSPYVQERAGWIEEQMHLLGPAYLRQL